MSQSKRYGSPTRTYVAMCWASKSNGNGMWDTGYKFRKFHLPETFLDSPMENSPSAASWYFLNVLNFYASIECCITFEDFCNVEDQDKINAEIEQERLKLWGK